MAEPIDPYCHYPLASCDVSEAKHAELGKFRRMRAKWLMLFGADPVHAISNQLTSMLWADATYRSLNEARRYASEAAPTSAISPILAEFLDAGYVATQVLAIGKLTEKSYSDPNRSVISLRRVVDEISHNRDLFTRENYICFDALPFDPEPVRQARERTAIPGEARWLPHEGPEAWLTSESYHKIFDQLSGTSAGGRARTDRVSGEVFDKLVSAFDHPGLKAIELLRQKFIAHAADRTNRPATLDDLTLETLADAQRVLTQLAFVVSSNILVGSGMGAVPTPQFNQFEHLETVFLPADRIDDLRAFWDRHASERDAWNMEAAKSILGVEI